MTVTSPFDDTKKLLALAPTDRRYGYRNVRYVSSPGDRKLSQWRTENTWLHQRPFSVLIAAMGNHWRAGSWQKVLDMAQFANDQGFSVAIEELMDRCFQPYDAIGAMRNEAIMKAQQGYEFLLYVDNDVLPPPDMLVRLLSWDVPIVAPLVLEPGSGKPLHGPWRRPNSGLQATRWCVLSMLLFKTTVFNATGPEFWNDSIGADEGYHFQKLWHYGHRPYLDTNQLLEVADIPTYPLASNRMTQDDYGLFWGLKRRRFIGAPNREPIEPNDPRVDPLGEYLPFGGPAPAVSLTAVASVNSGTVVKVS